MNKKLEHVYVRKLPIYIYRLYVFIIFPELYCLLRILRLDDLASVDIYARRPERRQFVPSAVLELVCAHGVIIALWHMKSWNVPPCSSLLPDRCDLQHVQLNAPGLTFPHTVLLRCLTGSRSRFALSFKFCFNRSPTHSIKTKPDTMLHIVRPVFV